MSQFERNGVTYASYQELAGHPLVYDMIEKHVDEVNRSLASEPRMGGAQIVPGGIMDKPAPIPVSNVMVVCPVCGNPTRVGMAEKEAKGGSIYVRVCKREGCGQEIDK